MLQISEAISSQARWSKKGPLKRGEVTSCKSKLVLEGHALTLNKIQNMSLSVAVSPCFRKLETRVPKKHRDKTKLRVREVCD